MSNKEWLLNPSAIRKAKECIHFIENEQGNRLKLTNPEFLQVIAEYAKQSENTDLKRSYVQLARMAGKHIDLSSINSASKIIDISDTLSAVDPEISVANPDEKVIYKGKHYSKYNADGKEFKGLYRGQARYA